jgi:Spy/CpxP family protein refolding chaperone
MKKTIIFFAVITALHFSMIFAGPGEGPEGQGGPGNPEMVPPDAMMERGFNNAIDGLKLTDDQHQKLREIKDANKREVLNLRHEIQLAIMDIQDEYKKAASDEAKISSAIEKLAAAQKKLMKIRASEMLKMKAVLTPGQFKQFLNKLDRVKAKSKKGFLQKLFKK